MAGRYDHAARRKTLRRGRERGCWLYIPAEELRKVGFEPGEPPPFSRVWAGRKSTLLVQLYREA